MNPEWIYWEQALRPFRKKTADFSKLWNAKAKVKFPEGTKEVLPAEAFKKIRSMLCKDVVLHHVDFVAAADAAPAWSADAAASAAYRASSSSVLSICPGP